MEYFYCSNIIKTKKKKRKMMIKIIKKFITDMYFNYEKTKIK